MKASSPAAVTAGASHQRSVRRCGAPIAAREASRTPRASSRGCGFRASGQRGLRSKSETLDVRGRAGRGLPSTLVVRVPAEPQDGSSYGVSGMVTSRDRPA